jgi:hypothetical protein
MTTPVRIEAVESQLWLLSISGKCGPLFGVGGTPLKDGPKFGTFIDPGRWEGSDFFMPDNSNATYVVGSAAERLQELRLTNVSFEPAGLQPLPSD